MPKALTINGENGRNQILNTWDFVEKSFRGGFVVVVQGNFTFLFCRDTVKHSFYLGKSPKCGLVGWCDPKLLKSLFLWHIILGYPPGKPIKTNSAVFFNIVQMAFDPPSPLLF